MNGGPAAGGRRAAVRPRSAVAALVAAAACGLATGRFVLPPPPGTAHPAARSAPATKGASALATAGASAPTPAPSGSAPPEAATGPVTTADLLDPAAFGAVGITAQIYARDRFGDGAYANSACTGEKTLTETLGGPGAHFRGLVTSTRTDPDDPTMAVDRADQVAREVAAEALRPALAQNFTERLLLEEVPCQNEPPGHWVYGRTTTLELAPDVSASWMGTYQGSLNTSGTAPEGKEPCGGIAVLRSGNHYGVLEVDACLGTAAMSHIVRTALSQL
ncbi:hypothetical protein NMG29_02950 [Streptomyces cocklensis]|uniref:PknH-like extracellular domain-containing protein n=1 Tax=Actinacidiphila cocklensis TaxID=887465 RepID=A0A9W4GSS4_9ACTN|nr:hypothetical protein [Actinacidiphila cocklensis]MDD1057193.1 hypothetical protein [Actinacidiphila cocklensis]CAG6395061.1 conserved exported hypothetical protein [Actinacidiphila cocklensis]